MRSLFKLFQFPIANINANILVQFFVDVGIKYLLSKNEATSVLLHMCKAASYFTHLLIH